MLKTQEYDLYFR